MGSNIAVGAVCVGLITAGVVGGVALGELRREEDTRDVINEAKEAAAPLPAGGQFRLPSGKELPGVRPARVAEIIFERYDHDGDGFIDLRPKPWDEAVQLPERAPLEQVAMWAAADERVANYQGDAGDGGLTLPMQHDLPLLMRAAQRPEGGKAAQLGSLYVSPEMLAAELTDLFDTNGDELLQAGELVQMHTRYPTQVGNYRFVRVLHLGEWHPSDASRGLTSGTTTGAPLPDIGVTHPG